MSRLATHLTVNNIIQSLWFGWIVPTVRLDAPLSGRVAPGETLPCSSVGVEIQSYWSEKREGGGKGKNLGQPLLDKPLQSNSPGTAINRLLLVSAQNLTFFLSIRSSVRPSYCSCCDLEIKPPDFFFIVAVTKINFILFEDTQIPQLTRWQSG